jgi:hypothetical protein
MKPYGRRINHHNYEDIHPRHGHVNWWEVELNTINKKKERQQSKKEIKEQENAYKPSY